MRSPNADGISLRRRDDAPLQPLIRLIASGDGVALAELYKATCSKLLSIIFRIVQDRSESEDILQSVYMTVWSSAGAYRSLQASPMNWLITIARNRAIDHRRRGTVIDRDADDGAVARFIDPSPCALTLLDRKCQSRRLQILLDGLTIKEAAAVRMAFFEGHTYDEVAERLGLPTPTAHSVIRRSLIKLRAKAEPSTFL